MIVHVTWECARTAEISKIEYLSATPSECKYLGHAIEARKSERVRDSILRRAGHKVLVGRRDRNAVPSAKSSEVLDFAVIPNSCKKENRSSGQWIDSSVLRLAHDQATRSNRIGVAAIS